VDWFDSRKFKEGASLGTGSGNIALLGKAPHPNSAKVFINWLLSKEGQMAYQTIARQTGGVRNSLRTDIPKEDVPSYVIPLEGGKYMRLTDQQYSDFSPVEKFVKQVRQKR
jgi:ABC-type Fe3+ transport system substrate-binding protein